MGDPMSYSRRTALAVRVADLALSEYCTPKDIVASDWDDVARAWPGAERIGEGEKLEVAELAGLLVHFLHTRGGSNV